jgi:hypothetical protein
MLIAETTVPAARVHDSVGLFGEKPMIGTPVTVIVRLLDAEIPAANASCDIASAIMKDSIFIIGSRVLS